MRITLRATVTDYLAECRARRLSPKTINWYAQKLTAMTEGLAGQSPSVDTVDELQPIHLHTFIAGLDDNTRSGHTIRGYVQVIRGWLAYLEEEELVGVKLRRRLKLPKVATRLIPILAPETFEALVEATRFEMSPWLRLRDRAILLVLLETGIRASELCTLRGGDIDINLDPHVTVIGKGDKQREVGPLSPECCRALRRYLRAQPRRSEEALFLSRYHTALTVSGLDQLLYRLRDWAGLGRDGQQGKEQGQEVRPHVFRHSFAHARYREGMDIKRLSLLLGHSSLNVTEHYLRDFTSRDARQFQPAPTPPGTQRRRGM